MSSYKIPGITPEGHAAVLLKELGIPLIPPINPYDICKKKEIQVTTEPMEYTDAVLLRAGSSAEIILNSNNRYRSRDSFSLSHELGHYHLPGHTETQYRCTIKEILRYNSSSEKEREANRFAAELLMPTPWFKDRIRTSDVSLSLILSIAEECHTSLTATAIKISEICRDRFGIVYSEDGIISWTAQAKSFPYELRKGRIDERSPVQSFYDTGNLIEGIIQVPPFVWVTSPSSHVVLFEESVAMPYLDAVLTVITLPIDEDDDEWLDD